MTSETEDSNGDSEQAHEYEVHIIKSADAHVVAKDADEARKEAMRMLEDGEITGSGWHVHGVVDLGPELEGGEYADE